MRRWAATALLAVGVVAMTRAQAEPADPDIRRMVREISPARLEATVRKLVSFGTRNTLSAQDDPARGIGAACRWLTEQFEQTSRETGGRLQVEQQSFVQPVAPRVPAPTRVTNVVALLPGERATPEQRLTVIAAHYDSMCGNVLDATSDAPGANDDGSGVAAVLEMARVMVKHHFDAPIAFVCVAGEEQGLLGSTHFAEEAKRKGWRVEAMFAADTIGNTQGGNGVHDDRSIRVFSEGVPSTETPTEAAVRRATGGENDSPSRQLARLIKEVGERYVRDMTVTLITRRDRFGRGGDHIPFLDRGYAAVRLTEPNEDYSRQHQYVREEGGKHYGDTPEYVDYPYLAKVARVCTAAIAQMAGAPGAPRGVGILSEGMAYDTALRWSAEADPNLAGYEVVWRLTTEPTWTHSRAVGSVTRCTLEGPSKDNCFFGVRAVGRNGLKSLVSFPRPVRDQ